ncbi:MAG TPA: AAA family ATPase, partial [Candidatus Binatus sp.]|nr:AAA family ATPase [Candidatus Binatus sp.]
GGWLEPTEYTLVMRRLSEKRMLPFLLATGQVTQEMIEDLADLLSRFHGQADRGARIGAQRYLQVVEQQWSENIAEIRPFLRRARERDTYAALQTFGKDFLAGHAELLMRRAREGWIRDVHGDLHCDHINFAQEGIQIFDCIDFSPRLRRCDLASEIAFLLMDLQARGGAIWIQPFLKRYQAAINDKDLLTLLPFGKCYRALVRAKVHALRLGRWNDESAGYFRLAGQLTWDSLKPFVVLICGLTGSGKSTLSRALGERTGLTVINSDVVRKSITGKTGPQDSPLQRGIYAPAMTELTYADMLRQTEKQIEHGSGAIVDATFGRRAQREKFLRLAEKHHVPLAVIHCAASDAATEKRLLRRAMEGRDISDGRWPVYVEQKLAHEAVEEISPSSLLMLDTEAPVDCLATTSEQFLRSRLL